MSKVFRAIGTVAGVVAVVATVVGAPQVAGIAAAVSAASNTAAQLTAKRPATQGQVNEIIIGANNPQPYLMGRCYSGGVKLYDVGYGGKINGVYNPYRFMVIGYSCCGPVEELEALQFDYQTISFDGSGEAVGYYSEYFWRDYQLGERPEADALSPHFSGTPQWGSSYKLSGHAAIGHSFIWSKKGKRFTGGQIPAIGAIWKGVKVYDPRLDSTYSGGSGSHRIADESTWEYSRNPALHALTYAYGRYVNGVKVFGVDLGEAAIDIDQAVAWANTCDTNGWYVDGTIYEPGDKWNNLKRICECGAAEPLLEGGMLHFDYQAPRTSLGTIGSDDLADGQLTSRFGRAWKERKNTLVPRYRSEVHQWNYVQSAALSRAAWVTADGEVKSDERQWDLVTDKDQVAQLGMYALFQMREAGPISFTCKPHMRAYGPGDCLTLLEELGAHPDGQVKVVIRRRSIDPISGTVTFECEAESDAKHTISLNESGTAPDTLTIPSAEDFDEALFVNSGIATYTADLTGVTADTTQVTADAT